MKMAKASKDDIQRCVKFFQFVEEYFEEGTYTPSDTDEPERLTESDFVEQLREMWGGRLWGAGVDRLRGAGVDCAWSRVVYGCGILIDNACDPNADTLEWKPELVGLLPLADDSEPITEGFIESLKPPRYWEAGCEYAWPEVGLRYAVKIGDGKPPALAAGFYLDAARAPVYLTHIRTRGDARRLLKALGVNHGT